MTLACQIDWHRRSYIAAEDDVAAVLVREVSTAYRVVLVSEVNIEVVDVEA